MELTTASDITKEIYQVEMEYSNDTLNDLEWSGHSVHVHSILQFSLYILGIITSGISCHVFLSTALHKFPTSHYLAALAMSDLGYLLFLTFEWLTLWEFVNIVNHNVTCQFIKYGNYSLELLSAWFLVTACIDRYLAVAFPSKIPRLCTVFRAKVAVVILCVTAIDMHVYYTWSSTINTYDKCVVLEALKEVTIIIEFARNLIAIALPTFTMFIFCCLIIKNMLRIRLCQHGEGLFQVGVQEDSTYPTPRGSAASAGPLLGNTNICWTVLVVVVIHILATAPFCCLILYSYLVYFVEGEDIGHKIGPAFNILNTMYLVDRCLRILIYIAVCRRFRRSLIKMLFRCCTSNNYKCAKKKDIPLSTMETELSTAKPSIDIEHLTESKDVPHTTVLIATDHED